MCNIPNLAKIRLYLGGAGTDLIPHFDEHGLLPLGLHDTSLQEIRTVLGFTSKRNELINGLEEFLNIWNASGFLDYSIIDGSFVTSKPEPGDIDLILVLKENATYNVALIDLLRSHSFDVTYTQGRFGCHAFPATSQAHLAGWIDFFKHEKTETEEGKERGLLRLGFSL